MTKPQLQTKEDKKRKETNFMDNLENTKDKIIYSEYSKFQ
jgi:hypothetical protein